MKISKYLIRRIDPRIPDYIYSAFPSIASDTEMLHKVYKAYKLGIDSDYALAYFSMNSTGIIITKLSTYRIDPERKIIIAVLPNSLTAIIPIELFDAHTPEELVEKLKLPLELHVKYKKNYLIVEDLKIPTLKTYKDIAKEITEEIGVYNALLIGLGIRPSLLTYFMYLARIIPLFKGFFSETDTIPYAPIHTIQLTSPNTGKTHYAIRISDIANFEYLGGELPTPARLVYDARSMQYGIVALRDGMILDEFDKRASQIMQQFTLDLRILLTGLEQCVWTRGSGTKSASIRKCINTLVFGNVPRTLRGNTTREQIINYVGISGTDAFIDRYAIVDIWEGKYNITDYVINAVLPNSIMRGIIENVIEELKPEPLSIEIKGSREPRHAMNIKSILKALNINLNDETIKALVTGSITFEIEYKTTPPQDEYINEKFPDYQLIKDKINDILSHGESTNEHQE